MNDILQKLDAIKDVLDAFDDGDMYSDLRDALSYIPEIRAALEAMQWRPIETAPKDGSYILCMSIGHTLYKGVVQEAISMCYFNNEWVAFNGDGDFHCPTHWMPLPTPPEGGSDAT